MDLATCLKKMELVGVLAFATVDSEGAPQIRNISAIHYEPDALYFFTARGKNFCKELMEDGRVQILAYTKYKEMIRLSGKAYAVAENEQKKWMDLIFEEQPYLANVYPGDTREIGIIFCIDKAEVEYFNLGVNPIFRETYILGNVSIKEKGYYITESCIGCGTCMKKMELVGVLAFATVDSDGAPQIRNISAIHYEPDAIYFFTARGKNFCRELLEDGRVQILCYTKYKEMIRMSGRAYAVPEEEQAKWRDIIFEEQPYLANVYPGDTRSIGIIFCIDRAEVEYFNLGVNPIFRDTYTLGGGTITKKGYNITEKCIGCGKCRTKCPQRCIEEGKPYRIQQNHCLHCGNCYENCPVKAIVRE